MKTISEKRRILYLNRLGYVPQRTLTHEERIKCGLKVSAGSLTKTRTIRKYRESPNYPDAKRGTLGPAKFPKPGQKENHNDPLRANDMGRPRRSNRAGYKQTLRVQAATTKAAGLSPCRLQGVGMVRARQFLDPRSYITKDGRYRLKGADHEALRRQAYHRAYGKCERIVSYREDDDAPMLCVALAPWDGRVFTRGHLAHKKHGPRKSDTLDEVLWSCAACHFAEHGPRWRKQRMAKAWQPKQFELYYHESCDCVCGQSKYLDSSMCADCRGHLRDNQPALLHVIENGTGDPILQAMGEFQELVRGAK